MTPPAGPSPVPVEGGDQRLRHLEQELLDAGRELARLHRDLESQRERSRREGSEREELLTIVSHELRTPVTVICGYHRLLLSEEVGPLNAEQRKFLQESDRSCRRLDSFIANLLEASHAADDGEVLEIGRGPLAPVVHGVAEMLGPLLAERAQKLAIALDVDEARFDRLRLERVLGNLLANALKYTPAGGSIEIAARALDADQDWVEISVSDDGPGIAEAERERVFEPYVRLDGERGAGGLGLGLAICRRLVEAHGGEIGLAPSASGGCRFHFTLPAGPTAQVRS